MKAYAYPNIIRNAVEILVVDESFGRQSIARPAQLVFEAAEDNVISEPTLTLPRKLAESLLQALWDAGLRPNDGEGSSGQVAALKAHIAFAERVADRLLKPAQ